VDVELWYLPYGKRKTKERPNVAEGYKDLEHRKGRKINVVAGLVPAFFGCALTGRLEKNRPVLFFVYPMNMSGSIANSSMLRVSPRCPDLSRSIRTP